MRKVGKYLLYFGLGIGLLIGLSIVILEKYIAGQLVGLLEDEVSASCACEFKVDKIDFSIFALSATAKNASISENGQQGLFFEKLKLTVGLKDIRDKKVYLNRLDLIDGLANGVGPNSPTFKFVDYLAAPLPPELDRPDRWRVKLLGLKIKNLKIIEDLGDSELHALGADLDLKRTASNDFILKPNISSLNLVSKTGSSPLGALNADLEILDQKILYNFIDNINKNSKIKLSGSSSIPGNKLDASADISFNTEDYGIKEVSTHLKGTAKLSGTIAEPNISSDFRSINKENAIKLNDIEILPLKLIQGSFELSSKNESLEFRLNKLKASNDTSSIRITEDLVISPEALSGKLNINIGDLQYQNIQIKDLRSSLNLAGTIDQTEINFQGKTGELIYDTLAFKNTNFEIKSKDQQIDLRLNHYDQDTGNMNLVALVGTTENSNYYIKNLDFNFNDYAFQPQGIDYLQELKLTGEGSLKGEMSLKKLEGQGSLALSSRFFAGESALKGDFSISDGKLSAQLLNPSRTLTTNIIYDLNQKESGKVKIALKDFELKEYNPQLECVKVSLESEYNFPKNDLLAGNGYLDLKKFNLGCQPYQISIANKIQQKIVNGTIKDLNLSLKGEDSNLSIKGSISAKEGLDLKGDGSVKLKTFIHFLPFVDDLRGDLNTNFSLAGPYAELQYTGQAELKNAEFSIAEVGMEGDNFNGILVLDENEIVINDFSGIINDSSLSLIGRFNPLDIKKTNVDLTYEELSIEPNSDLAFNTSGNFNLSPDDLGKLALSGELLINDAVFRKDLSFRAILTLLKDLIFKSSEAITEEKLPEVNLDIQILAKRNIFIITNLLETELDADLHVTGNLQTPVITGDLNTLYGWFGLSNSRFNISSGIVSFKPHQFEPVINILAETDVVDRIGEVIYIVLEAQGKLSSPRINLIADANLSQPEILTLLTTRGAYRVRSQASSVGSKKLSELKDKNQEDQNVFQKLFKGFTNIDSLGIEPAYNNRTGLIEPSLIAEKKLTRNISLSSESFIGGSSNDSRFRMNYDFNRYVTFSGIVDTITTQTNTALGFDTSFTILSKRKEQLAINFSGDFQINQNSILEQLRLNEDSKIPFSEIATIKSDLLNWLIDQGYFDAEVEINCEVESDLCRMMNIEINSGKVYLIDQIEFLKDKLPADIEIKLDEDQIATKEFKELLRNDIIRALRSEGYLSTRLKNDYVSTEDQKVKLLINLNLGTPVSFNFIGNTVFSPEELLKSINLFERSQPFGNNTINILIENIEKLYRNKGYLYASFAYDQEYIEEESRTLYIININEEDRITNIDVQMSGLKNKLEQRLREEIQEQNQILYDQIFQPEHAIAEEIESNIYYIGDLLIELGYQEPSINYKIRPDDQNKKVIIEYKFELQDQILFEKINIDGFPENLDFTYPNLPDKQISITKVNRYLDLLLDNLSNNGYLQPSIYTLPSDDFKTIEIVVEIEPAVKIGTITCKGNIKITCDQILATSKLITGAQYRKEIVNRARTNLLKLGLFQYVNVETSDNKVDQAVEDIIITVTERPFQTVDVGIGVNSELGLHLFGETVDRGLFKDGKTLSLRLDGYYDDTTADVSQGVAGLRFQNPDFFGTDIKFTKDFNFQKYDNPTLEFDLDRFVSDTTIQQSWANGLAVTLGHSILFEDLDRVTPDAILSDLDTGDVELSYFYGSLSYDLRDDPLSPSKGAFFGLDYKFASESILSDANFYTANGRASWILPFGTSPFSIANNTAVGASWTFKDTPEVPITQRFYLGGRNSIRGFRENSLGPKGEEGAVLGGDFTFGNNLEFRYLAANNLSLHTFYDTGSVFLRDREIDFSDLRESVGLGFRYVSPIGPIGIDVGKPLDEQPGEPSIRLHFSVGSVF